MKHNVYLYIFVMAAVTYLIRVLPLTLIRKPIRNRTIRSFLYYVPYVTLAVMTFPAIVNATQSPAAGAVALVVGIALNSRACEFGTQKRTSNGRITDKPSAAHSASDSAGCAGPAGLRPAARKRTHGLCPVRRQ